MSKKFDCPDGTLIEVRSDNAIRWRPDTCQCVLVLEMDTNELDFAEQVCDLHKTIADADLVSTIRIHHKAINEQFGNIELTDVQRKTISKARRTEFNRINTLGRPTVKADAVTKDTIEADLRAKGR